MVVASLVVALTVVLVANDDAPSERGPSGRADACRTRVASGPAAVDSAAPDFRLPGLDGGCVDLSAFHGRPVVVNFWASWCNPCRREFPLLRAALEDHADADIEIIGIVYRDIADDARAFASGVGATWPLALDDDSAAATAYGVRAIPQTFFIRRDGTIARHVFGLTTRKELERHLRSIT